MGHFTTNGKRYREGDVVPSFSPIDSTISSAPTLVSQTAPDLVLGPGGQTRQFLYWDTGRRITTKRTVHWTFTNPGNWTEWNAIAWYGLPGPGGIGEPIVTTDAHWVGVSPINPTPITPPPPPGSSFVNAPGGSPAAWPWSGNDHLVRTEWGAATIVARPNLQRSAVDPVLDFTSWTQLIFGGDPTGFFSESDADITSPITTITGIETLTGPSVTAPMGSGGVYLAGYVLTAPGRLTPPDFWEKLRAVLADPSIFKKFIDKGDPSPEDWLRLKLIAESLDLVRGVKPTEIDAFEGLVAAAKKMAPAELKRTIAGTKSTLARGEAALKAMQALQVSANKRK